MQVVIDALIPGAVNKVLAVTRIFGKVSGLKLSETKSEIMGIGNAGQALEQAGRSRLRIVDKLKFVGAWIHATPEKESDDNFEQILKKMKLVQSSLNWRKPTPLGAALWCKALVSSIAVHILHNFIPKEQWHVKASDMIRKLLWVGGRHHVRKQRVHDPCRF